MTPPTRTLNLMRSIDSGRIAKGSVEDLSELARLNKVLLGFLRRIGYGGPLRTREENLYRRYMIEVSRVSEALNNLDYALFKFRKPIEHVSVDIDVLVRYEHLPKAVKNLAELGFRVEVSEPYTVTIVRGKTIVDLYTHPSFAWIVYLNGERLLENMEMIEVNGVKAKALTTEAEAITTVAHAIYKEHIYLLTDYYVTKQWLNSGAINLARELNAEEALQMSLKLNKYIEKGLVETPIKLNPTQIVEILARKFMKDSNFRTTTINMIKLATKKRTIQELTSRIKRKSY